MVYNLEPNRGLFPRRLADIYDASGQRVKLTKGAVTTTYPSMYYNTDGTTPMKHIFAGGVDAGTVKGSGATAAMYYTHTDQLTGANVVTNSTGVQQELMDYFPFGSIRVDTKTGSYSNQRKFTGYEYDIDTGLNYANARYYDAARGQFTSEDPAFLELGDANWLKQDTGKDQLVYLSNPQALNSYAYVGNNPITKTDPTGKAFVIDDAIGFFGGGLIGTGLYAFSSVIARENVSWSGTSGAFVTGGIIGWGAVNTPETLGVSNVVSASITTGLIGGFYGNLTKQGIDMAAGKQAGGLNSKELGTSALVTAGTNGALQGLLPDAKIAGFSSGRGNMNAVGNAMRTKAANGSIGNISLNTAIKSSVGSQAADLYRTVIGGLVDVVRSAYNKLTKK